MMNDFAKELTKYLVRKDDEGSSGYVPERRCIAKGSGKCVWPDPTGKVVYPDDHVHPGFRMADRRFPNAALFSAYEDQISGSGTGAAAERAASSAFRVRAHTTLRRVRRWRTV